MRLPILLFFSWTFFSSPNLSAKKKSSYDLVDSTIINSSEEFSFDGLVTFVNDHFISDEEKVRAFYTWTATHIDYDVDLMRRMEEVQKMKSGLTFSSSQSADSVFLKRKAVCEGYSNLMKKFCEASYISCQLIPGYTKYQNETTETNLFHAWNAVKIDGEWKLMDATWASGSLDAEGHYERKFSDNYFLKDPEGFVKDHLPFDPMWQLLEQPVTKNSFANNVQGELAYFNYNDSISAYFNENPKQRPLLDMVHAHRFDPSNAIFMKGIDVTHNNIAAAYLKTATRNFVQYLDFFNEVFLKEQTSANYQAAISLLKASRSDLSNAISYLSDKTALTEEFKNNFSEINNSALNKMAVVNKNIDVLTRLEKNYVVARRK
jgi:hypothetical protein